jgi:ubiquinone/menaquinone biosynthesis C-methylase UbiE
MREHQSDLEASYDRVAANYADEFFGELERKPFDRELLNEFACRILSIGQVCEIGCGPGQISRYLKDCAVDVCGIDLSHEMVKQARRLNPDIEFESGDMLALECADASFAAIVCFYAIIHLRREDVKKALREMNRVLHPGGPLLLSFHSGEGSLHRDQWYDKAVSIEVSLFTKNEMSGYVKAAGFEIEKIVEREPYEFEYPTQRVYLLARKHLSAL